MISGKYRNKKRVPELPAPLKNSLKKTAISVAYFHNPNFNDYAKIEDLIPVWRIPSSLHPDLYHLYHCFPT